ncbi:MAG: peptidoglycan-binding domain-containing protein [Candidatus Omnitrophica bacterium]|nr:peptidoglycan-binding domain-containing protein [Candidatus Omnitrophota bacterium]
MNINKAVFLVGVSLFLAGCATTGTNLEMENQGLRTQVTTLENQVKEKDSEIESMESELSKLNTQPISNKTKGVISSKTEFSVTNIQAALKNAGFDPGSIDGKIGKKTRIAIRGFQKAQGLNPDGIVGNRTWEKLKEFLK